MTWITDHSGTYWVDPPPQKAKRKRGRGRFADIKVGDQLMQRQIRRWTTMGKDEIAANDPAWIDHERDCGFQYAIVTDIWFDPVAGQSDPLKGEMVGIQPLYQGRARGSKVSHTIRGLASNRWQYADRDDIAHWDAVREAHQQGKVIGIGKGRRNKSVFRTTLL